MLLYLTAMAVGAGLLACDFRPSLLDEAVAYIRQPPGRFVAMGVAAIFLLGPLAIFLRWWQARRNAREISYTTETGRVSVNMIAVEEALTRAVENENFVKKAHVRLREDRSKRQVIIEAVMTLWEVPNVTERNLACQQILRRRFAELMPEKSAVVNLSVHRLNQRREDHKKATEPPPPPPLPTIEPTPPERVETNAATAELPQEVENLFGEPPTNEEDLYVGPSYPVEKDEEEDAMASYFDKKKSQTGKKS